MIRAALAFLLLASPMALAAKSVPPRDECNGVQGANAFRLALTTAVANRDENMLAALAEPEVLLDFGGGSGRDTLMARLDDGDYELWQELDRLLLLGCAAGEDASSLTIPWLFAQDLGTEDAFSTFVATGSAVPLRSAPDAGASVVATLDWDVVTMTGEWTDDAEFFPVRTASGSAGFVAVTQLRSQVDYRLLAVRGDDGEFRINALVAGD